MGPTELSQNPVLCDKTIRSEEDTGYERLFENGTVQKHVENLCIHAIRSKRMSEQRTNGVTATTRITQFLLQHMAAISHRVAAWPFTFALITKVNITYSIIYFRFFPTVIIAIIHIA